MPPKTKKMPGATAPGSTTFPTFDPTNPFIVQSDRSILVEVDNPKYAEARDALAPFAELEKSPEHIHTYRISNLSLWNAAAAGITADADGRGAATATPSSRFPPNLPADIAETVSRYGRVRLERIDAEQLQLVCADKPLLEELSRQTKLQDYLGEQLDDASFAIEPAYRGVLKQALIAVGYPAEDLAGYTEGAALPLELRDDRHERPAVPRPRLPARRGRRLLRRRRRPRRLAASSCCPAAPARPSSASPPWRCCRRAR